MLLKMKFKIFDVIFTTTTTQYLYIANDLSS